MPTSVSMKWHGPRIERGIRSELESRLDACGDALATQTQVNIAAVGPPASAPGQYPHRISGELQESVGYRLNRRDLAVTVTASAEHAKYVESMRPFLRRTFREMRSKLRAIMLGSGARSGRFKFK